MLKPGIDLSEHNLSGQEKLVQDSIGANIFLINAQNKT